MSISFCHVLELSSILYKKRCVQFMFYDIYAYLCRQIGKSPSSVAQELGINKSNVTNWKNNGYTPRGDTLNKIAEYFNVSIDFLLRDGTPKESVTSDMAESEDIRSIHRGQTEESNFQISENTSTDTISIDEDIRRIERARTRMNDREKADMMKILEISFKQFFADDFEDDDVD